MPVRGIKKSDLRERALPNRRRRWNEVKVGGKKYWRGKEARQRGEMLRFPTWGTSYSQEHGHGAGLAGNYKETALDKMNLKYCENSPAVVRNLGPEHKGPGGSESHMRGGCPPQRDEGMWLPRASCGAGRNRTQDNSQTAFVLPGSGREQVKRGNQESITREPRKGKISSKGGGTQKWPML